MSAAASPKPLATSTSHRWAVSGCNHKAVRKARHVVDNAATILADSQ
eukprot:CAMPEP_0178375052 /NCGR_PEP_ID=MMETSP0689_2-20121128/2690_1 /TAXON_ID=160604 /ORGANISM="Amphidinium massartii, Strain CS-259" /LENGTH=46 /DNA_ID= /DNA_START= /DNA_END= /DNA_ORIENTATION=